MPDRKWYYRVGFAFTGGPTHPAEALPGEPARWTGDGSSGCNLWRHAPLTEADWPALGDPPNTVLFGGRRYGDVAG